MNLVIDKPASKAHYWCTWGAQCSQFVRPGEIGGAGRLDEQLLFGEEGWLKNFYPTIRRDLLVLIDAGWDIPRGLDSDAVQPFYGSFVPDPERFPGLTGSETDKLSELRSRAQALGWGGVGLWLIAQGHGEASGKPRLADEVVEADWRKKARWSRDAGIDYWKVDFGMRGEDLIFRRNLTRLLREEAPGTLIEHVRNMGPINGMINDPDANPIKGIGRFEKANFQQYRGGALFESCVMLLHLCDVMRTYDVAWTLSIPITLDRVSSILKAAAGDPVCTAILNCEDEMYMGAALGCALGILRYPEAKPEQPTALDPHGVNQRTDEAVRAVRWSRIAPPVPAGVGSVERDSRILVDRWLYRPGDVYQAEWDNQIVNQGAPARVSRDMPLPVVEGVDDPPFVVCSRHPNGATAVATLPRTSLENRNRSTPLADVSIESGDGKIGIFGRYRSLRVRHKNASARSRVWVQDLAGEIAVDVTSAISIDGSDVVFPGELLDRIGLQARSPGDLSDPACVVKIINDH